MENDKSATANTPYISNRDEFRKSVVINIILQDAFAVTISYLLNLWVGTQSDRFFLIIWPIIVTLVCTVINLIYGFDNKRAISRQNKEIRSIWELIYALTMPVSFVLIFLIGSIVTGQFKIGNLILVIIVVGGLVGAVAYGIEWIISACVCVEKYEHFETEKEMCQYWIDDYKKEIEQQLQLINAMARQGISTDSIDTHYLYEQLRTWEERLRRCV